MKSPAPLHSHPALVAPVLAAFLAASLGLAFRSVHSFRALSSPEPASAVPAVHADSAGRFLQALEYVAGDYHEAVVGGRILDYGEYEEQVEFLAKAGAILAGFPPSAMRDSLFQGLRLAAAGVGSLAEPAEVETVLSRLMERLLVTGMARTAPLRAPDPARGGELYAARCATCHGEGGHGDGPAGRGLRPRPADFHDQERMARATPLKAFHAIRYGVDGTAMPSFAALPDEDLWSLAYHIRSLGSAPQAAVSGLH